MQYCFNNYQLGKYDWQPGFNPNHSLLLCYILKATDSLHYLQVYNVKMGMNTVFLNSFIKLAIT